MLNQQKLSGILYTRDKVSIAYDHVKNGHESIIVICPGFFNSKKNRWMGKTVDLVSPEYDAIIFDFRGHGESGGKFSWLAKEHLDMDTVLNYASTQGYRYINILAFSLGAAASINIAHKRNDINSMVLIGCPFSFWKIDYHFWKPEMLSDLKDNFDCNWEGKGARVASLFIPKPKPISNVAKIKKTPIFYIHGSDDWVVGDHHSKKLYNATKTYKKIEIIKNGLHAERLIQQHPDRMKKLILEWFLDVNLQKGNN